jgi:hypothetical protein
MWCIRWKRIKFMVVLALFLAIYPSQVQAVKWVTPQFNQLGLGHVCNDGAEVFHRWAPGAPVPPEERTASVRIARYHRITGESGDELGQIALTIRPPNYYLFEILLFTQPLAVGELVVFELLPHPDFPSPIPSALRQIGVVEECNLLPVSTVTVVTDAQPNQAPTFRFTGSLGEFVLDPILPPADDHVRAARTFTVPLGVHTITQQIPVNWHLMDIACEPASNVLINPATHTALISLTTRADITCTFVNQQAGQVRAIKYNDQNINGQRDALTSEPGLPGWSFHLYDAWQRPVASRITNRHGRVSFLALRPGLYTLCEELGFELELEGWRSTQPGARDPDLIQPCHRFKLAPGRVVLGLFGNSQQPLGAINAAATNRIRVDAASGLTEMTIDSVTGDDEGWLNRADQEPTSIILLPLVSR